MHARRYFFKALDSDETRMGPALHLIARLYRVEERAKALELTAAQRQELRRHVSSPVMDKPHAYLMELKQQILPKSPSGAAVRYALNLWQALIVYLEDGDLQIDNGATERANRDIAVGRGNWTILRRRRGRQDSGDSANVHRFVQTQRSRAVRLVPRPALAHRRSPGQPDRGTTAS
jgi:transposase